MVEQVGLDDISLETFQETTLREGMLKGEAPQDGLMLIVGGLCVTYYPRK